MAGGVPGCAKQAAIASTEEAVRHSDNLRHANLAVRHSKLYLLGSPRVKSEWRGLIIVATQLQSIVL